jgi:hypothetical protein
LRATLEVTGETSRGLTLEGIGERYQELVRSLTLAAR